MLEASCPADALDGSGLAHGWGSVSSQRPPPGQTVYHDITRGPCIRSASSSLWFAPALVPPLRLVARVASQNYQPAPSVARSPLSPHLLSLLQLLP